MAEVTLIGPGYSTYVRAARLALEEKGVPYDLEEVDIFGDLPADYLKRHPFGKVPAFIHGEFHLYETVAIGRYVDEAFDGPPLQPGGPREHARMSQVISIVDSYIYPLVVTILVVQRLVRPLMKQETDEGAIGAAMPDIERSLTALEALMSDYPILAGPFLAGPFLAGRELSLADLHLAPIAHYLSQTPEGETLLGGHAALASWWGRMKTRDSLARTEPKLG